VPFETFSNELNHALDGGFLDIGMNLVVGGPKAGKTVLAIDLVARYMRRPGAAKSNVVVISPDLTAWHKAIQDNRISAKVILSGSPRKTRGITRALTIAEATAQGENYYIGDTPLALAEVVMPDACTIFLSSKVTGLSAARFNAILELSTQNGVYYANLIKNRVGEVGKFNITRREIVEQDESQLQSCWDMLLSDDDIE
jgi:hypothetical protein